MCTCSHGLRIVNNSSNNNMAPMGLAFVGSSKLRTIFLFLFYGVFFF